MTKRGHDVQAQLPIEPISVRIPTAVAMTGLSRSRIYELIAAGEIRVAKDRRSTLIMVDSLRETVRRREAGGGDQGGPRPYSGADR